MYTNIVYNSKERSIIWWDRDKDGKLNEYREEFSPYLFLETNSNNPDALSIFNTKLKRMDFKTNFDRYKFMESNKNHRIFHGLMPVQQFLLDKFALDPDYQQNIEDKELRIGFIDIECYSPDEFPDAEEANHPINLVTIYDNWKKEFQTWGVKDYKPKQDNVIYHNTKTEKNLLESLVQYLVENRFDIITGWNTHGFDFPYIFNRISNILGAEVADRISPVGNVYYRPMKQTPGNHNFLKGKWHADGVSLMDYMDIYKVFCLSDRESFSLNYIAEYELGESKIAVSDPNLASLSISDWEQFVDYNIQDVNLLVRLDEKLNYIMLVKLLAYNGFTTFDSSLGKISIIAGAVGREAIRTGKYILTKDPSIRERFIPGAFVKEPEYKGILKDIVSFDINSLYPNTMIALNISQETKLGKYSKLNEEEYEINIGNQSKIVSEEEFTKFVKDNNIACSSAGILYDQTERGIIPTLIETFYQQRVDIKKEIHELKQQVEGLEGGEERESIRKEIIKKEGLELNIKIFLNSIYGVFANKYSPLFDPDHACSITLTGQTIIKKAGEIIDIWGKHFSKDKDLKSLLQYQDTDSCYCVLSEFFQKNGVETKEEKGKYIKLLNETINRGVNKYVEEKINSHRPIFVFKREIIADAAVFLMKKRYILHIIDDDGFEVDKFKYKGVEIARTTTPKMVKGIIKDIIENILLKEDYSFTVDQIKTAFEDFQKLEIDDLSFRSGLKEYNKFYKFSKGLVTPKGCPIHAKSAIYYTYFLKKLKIENKYPQFKDGMKMKYVYVEPNAYNIDTIGYINEFPKEFEDLFKINYDLMFSKIVAPGIEAVFENISWFFPNLRKQVNTNLFELFA